MEIIYLKGQKIKFDKPICTALGFFDGLHIGHMALVNEVKRVAKEKGYKSALMTFDHHPLYILGKINEEKVLTTMRDRKNILEKEKIDYLFVIEFTKEVASLSPQDFMQKYLIDNHIKHVVCGFDFKFGRMNSGDTQTLLNSTEFNVSVVDEIIYEGEKVSSSRLRKLMGKGNIEDINALLGRHYCITGEVVGGRRIGHTIGFPTANINYTSYYLPQNGVYAVKVYIDDDCYLGMCNIGYNPTFVSLDKPSLEVYIFDFHKDIYGKEVVVEFYKKTRDEVTFASKEQLIEQLHKDQEEILNYYKK